MTHPVGQKLPNPWGLYDMHGNVQEWVQDWYADYLGGITVDPQGPATGSDHVYRGGSYYSWDDGKAWLCRAAARSTVLDSYPGSRSKDIGFRVVLGQGNSD
jgi:formylglycine-generating enzyme required for sulfatase activity